MIHMGINPNAHLTQDLKKEKVDTVVNVENLFAERMELAKYF